MGPFGSKLQSIQRHGGVPFVLIGHVRQAAGGRGAEALAVFQSTPKKSRSAADSRPPPPEPLKPQREWTAGGSSFIHHDPPGVTRDLKVPRPSGIGESGGSRTTRTFCRPQVLSVVFTRTLHPRCATSDCGAS